ncbi:hypothetical protein [Bacterioplanoides sp.]|uniref:hypothetical protein n=1 Tax=Bacterioplanoides sp. TaxID=2066072 RepID=UPI003B00ADE7
MEAIQQLIDNAITAEASHQHLHQALSGKLEHVDRLVQLPEDQAAEKLHEFVVRYIQNVPTLLNSLQSAALEVGLVQYVQPVIRVASEFFTAPALANRAGLAALMGQAYLAMRLFEEVNETYVFKVGQPLIPMDMMMSNLIIHTLIGEPFANDLDVMVTEAVEQLLSPAYQSDDFKAFMSQKEADNLVHICRQIPCMSAEMGLASQFG